MKKQLYIGALSFAFLAGACDKEESVSNSFNINSQQIQPYRVERSDDSLQALIAYAREGTVSQSVYFIFSSLPQSSNSYQIINHTRPGAGEVCICVVASDKGSYTSKPGGTVNVTEREGRLSVATSAPVWAKNIDNPADSVLFSGVISEQE